MFDVIAFDADDTLWHSESLYAGVQDRFTQLLAPYCDAHQVERRLLQIEVGNLQYYGYGVKGFTLSLIEAAIELSEGRIQGGDIRRVIDWAKDMLTAEVQLLDHAADTVAQLAESYPLMLITKGDLFDQEIKLARSGLGPYFRYVEVVSEKTAERYATVLARHRLDPSRLLMVGNSLRSDILPVLALGGQAVHIPYAITWAHEQAAPTAGVGPGYYELEHLGLLPGLVRQLRQNQG